MLLEGACLLRPAFYGTLSDVWVTAYFTFVDPGVLCVWNSKDEMEAGMPPVDGFPLPIEGTFHVLPLQCKNYSKAQGDSVFVEYFLMKDNFLFGKTLCKLGALAGDIKIRRLHELVMRSMG